MKRLIYQSQLALLERGRGFAKAKGVVCLGVFRGAGTILTA